MLALGADSFAQAPQPEKRAAPRHAISFSSQGLEAILADPKDKGLVEALRLIDERVLELPAELNKPIPAPPIQLVLELLSSPFSFRAGVLADEPIEGPPFYAQLEFMTDSREKAQALAGRFAGTLAMFAPPSQPAPDHPGLKQIDLEGAPLYYGPLMIGGKPAFVLALNKVSTDALEGNRADLAQDVQPAMTFTFDTRQLQPLLDMALAQAGPDADMAKAHLMLMGLYGPNALSASGAIGHGKDRAHASVRIERFRQAFAPAANLPEEASAPLISTAFLPMRPSQKWASTNWQRWASLSKARFSGLGKPRGMTCPIR
jgi:hypothetical protein